VAWPGEKGNRLIVADTVEKKLRVYRLVAGAIRLAAARSYAYDLKVGATPSRPRGGFTYEQMRAVVEGGLAGPEAQKPPRGREIVLATAGEGRDPGQIVLINPVEKRILSYRLRGNSLLLVAVRPYEYDEKLLYTISARGAGYSYDAVRKMVEPAMRKSEAKGEPMPEIRPELRAAKIQRLVEQLGHQLSSARSAAARSLGAMDPPATEPEARRALEKALDDKSSSVRKAAAEALKKIRAASTSSGQADQTEEDAGP
jgi:hypothetical protein